MRLGNERREEVLSVPERQYKREILVDPIVEIGGLDGDALRLPDAGKLPKFGFYAT